MAEARKDIAPAGWQITAITLSCDRVSDYVTLMVKRDWSCECAWRNRHNIVALQNPKRKFSRDIKARIAKCQWPDCKYVLEYRDKLIAEETAISK